MYESLRSFITCLIVICSIFSDLSYDQHQHHLFKDQPSDHQTTKLAWKKSRNESWKKLNLNTHTHSDFGQTCKCGKIVRKKAQPTKELRPAPTYSWQLQAIGVELNTHTQQTSSIFAYTRLETQTKLRYEKYYYWSVGRTLSQGFPKAIS